MIVMRCLWLERNARVFDNAALQEAKVIDAIVDERKVWCTRGGGHDREAQS